MAVPIRLRPLSLGMLGWRSLPLTAASLLFLSTAYAGPPGRHRSLSEFDAYCSEGAPGR